MGVNLDTEVQSQSLEVLNHDLEVRSLGLEVKVDSEEQLSPYRSEPNGFAREREADRFREPGRVRSGFGGEAPAPPSAGGFRGRSENGFSGGFSSGRRGGLLELMARGPPSVGMYGERQNGLTPSMQPTRAPEHPNCVLMVYGLDPKRMNCEKLFNLLCLYGMSLGLSSSTLRRAAPWYRWVTLQLWIMSSLTSATL